MVRPLAFSEQGQSPEISISCRKRAVSFVSIFTLQRTRTTQHLKMKFLIILAIVICFQNVQTQYIQAIPVPWPYHYYPAYSTETQFHVSLLINYNLQHNF